MIHLPFLWGLYAKTRSSHPIDGDGWWWAADLCIMFVLLKWVFLHRLRLLVDGSKAQWREKSKKKSLSVWCRTWANHGQLVAKIEIRDKFNKCSGKIWIKSFFPHFCSIPGKLERLDEVFWWSPLSLLWSCLPSKVIHKLTGTCCLVYIVFFHWKR